MFILIILFVLSLSGSMPASAAESAATASAAQQAEYYCPMHPQIVQEKPGQCPICFMTLVLRTGDRLAAKASSVANHATISVDPDAIRLLGVRTEKVGRRALEKTLVLPGVAVHDEELFDAQVEYIKTLTSQKLTDKELYKSIGPRWYSLGPKPAQTSRIKLMRLGMDEASIDELTPASRPDFRLLHLKDMSGEAWVYASALPADAALVHKGDEVSVESAASPGMPLRGTVEGVAPFADMETRTVRIRILVQEEGRHLVPDTPVKASIRTSLGEAVAVSETAVLFSGESEFVFVQTGPASYEPRPVHTGRKAGGYYEVLHGLDGGETVAANGTFFLDSESRLQSAFIEREPGMPS